MDGSKHNFIYLLVEKLATDAARRKYMQNERGLTLAHTFTIPMQVYPWKTYSCLFVCFYIFYSFVYPLKINAAVNG